MSKTFLRMLLFSGILVISMIFGFSFVGRTVFEDVIEDTLYEKNMQELNIIGDFIQSRHDSYQQTLLQLTEDSVLDAFLFDTPMDSAEGYQTMIRYQKELRVNPMFHSMSLYSGYTGDYYSTLTSRAGEDPYLRQLVQNKDSASVLYPCYRILPLDIYQTSAAVFSYFYFETDSLGQITKAISINLDAEQFCNYLNGLKGNNAHTYIIDLHNQVIFDGSYETQALDSVSLSFVRKILAGQSAKGCFTDSVDGMEQLITYRVLNNPNWILITEEPNNAIQTAMDTVSRYLLTAAALLIALGLLISFLFFHRVYKPWGTLYRQLSSSDQTGRKTPSRLYNDVQAIENSIRLTQNQLTSFLKYQNSTQNLLLESYVRAVLREDIHFIEKLPPNDQHRFERLLSQPMETAVFVVEHWKNVKSSLPGSSDACTYAFSQLSSPLFTPHEGKTSFRWIYLGNGHFLLLVFPQMLAENPLLFRERILELQQHFTSQTGLSATVALGGTADSTNGLTGSYQRALALLDNCILYERQSLLEAPLPERNQTPLLYDKTLEKSLLEALTQGRTQDAEDSFETFLQKYRTQSRQTFLLYITQLFLYLDKQLYTTGQLQGVHSEIPFVFYQILSRAESLDDLREMFLDSLETIPSLKAASDRKENQRAVSIRDYIHAHYAEDISLKFLSAKFNLSQGYLNTIFKDLTGLSVFEYINQVRLDAAAKLLVETNASTLSIMEKCGFINESHFYKLFKARFEVTPRTYRIQNQKEK